MSKKFIVFSFIFWLIIFTGFAIYINKTFSSMQNKNEISYLYATDKNKLKNNFLNNRYDLDTKKHFNPIVTIIILSGQKLKNKYYSNSWLIDIIEKIDIPSNNSYLIYQSVLKNDYKLTKALMNKGLKVKITKDDNPFIYSAFTGNLKLMKLLYDAKSIDIQENIYTQKTDNGSALHTASKNGNIEIIRFLVKNKSDIHQKNKDGYSPLKLAILYDHRRVVEYLLQNGAKVDKSLISYAKQRKNYIIASILEKRIKNEK